MSPYLLIADHASNHVPDDIDLGIAPELLNEHMAIDIGVAELAALLCERIGMPAILGGVSRLVIDLNREVDAPGLIPISSDGHIIPGNQPPFVSSEVETRQRQRPSTSLGTSGLRDARIARFYDPYHAKIARSIAEMQPGLLISLHSFTPSLKLKPEEARPWEIGVLYNQDDRAARIAIPALAAAGVCVGDNLPYSGKVLNATMNRHGEGNGIPYLGLEVRQDLISDAAGVARWADVLVPMIEGCLQ